MWVKQCHKLPIRELLYTTYKNGDLGMVYGITINIPFKSHYGINPIKSAYILLISH